jgi:hypothetical protein
MLQVVAFLALSVSAASYGGYGILPVDNLTSLLALLRQAAEEK